MEAVPVFFVVRRLKPEGNEAGVQDQPRQRSEMCLKTKTHGKMEKNTGKDLATQS